LNLEWNLKGRPRLASNPRSSPNLCSGMFGGRPKGAGAKGSQKKSQGPDVDWKVNRTIGYGVKFPGRRRDGKTGSHPTRKTGKTEPLAATKGSKGLIS